MSSVGAAGPQGPSTLHPLERYPRLSANDRRRRVVNRIWLTLLTLVSFVAITPLFIIFIYVVYRGGAGLSVEFFTELPRPMGEPGGGMANAIVGSSVIVLLAALIGVPWGIGAGIYLAEYKGGATLKALRFVTDLLTSVPSIIVGLFGYALLVKPMGGYSAYAGGAALAIIMIPIVARTTEEMLKLIPDHIREAGLALGIPRWSVILRVVFPGSLAGVVTGVMLGLARVAGETAPLLFTSFSNNFGFRGLGEPTASLPVQIFNFAISHDQVWRQKAWTGALVLVAFIFTINLITRLLIARSIK